MGNHDRLPRPGELADFARRLRRLADACEVTDRSGHLARLVGELHNSGPGAPPTICRWYTAAVRQGAGPELSLYLGEAAAVLGRLAGRRMAQKVPGLEPPIALDNAAEKLRNLAAGFERLAGVEPADKTPGEPVVYLTSWREILVALGLKNNREDRERVRNLNDHYGGPILIPRQGAQPKVNRNTLLDWWNGLEAQWATGYARGRDAGPTAAITHPYGRKAEVVPEIGGKVKRRRSDRKS